jgi:hypothetical protein
MDYSPDRQPHVATATAVLPPPAAGASYQPMRLRAETRQGISRWFRADICAMSPQGCLLSPIEPIDAGQPLRVRLPGLQALTARVSGQRDDGRVECLFAMPLHVAVFDHLARQAR